jgi:glycosyltransferase involved in cell wall biosynthesis
VKILVLTQILPYPPDAGPRVKTWNVLRFLAAQGHTLELASFVRPEELAHLPVLENLCAAVYPIPIRRARWRDVLYGLRSLWRGRPFFVERDDLPAMRRLVAERIARGDLDAIHADQLTMAQFGLVSDGAPAAAPPLVFDAHNAVWTILDRARQTVFPPLRPLYAFEAARLRRYEGRLVREAAATLAVADPDRAALLEAVAASGGDVAAADARIHVMPISVDTQVLQPRPRPPADSREIVTLGTLHYPPNADGIRWFLQEVLPQVQAACPAAHLTVIGKNPPADFSALAAVSAGRVEVTGYVPDLDPYFARAAVLVVPVRSGGGMRVRILEGLARGVPMVTTTVGLEGIDARPGEDILVADTSAEFAAALLALLHDPALQERLARNGRRLAETRYDSQSALTPFAQVYAAPLEARP